MYRSRKHFAWALAGALLTLSVGSPAVADDVELLLSTPGASSAAKPNVLFIIDSSGSMTTLENSQEPFDSGEVYLGPCLADKLYWTTNSSIPACSTQFRIDKTSFVCDQGWTQISDSGSYTDTMAQYRPNNKGKWKWRRLHKNVANRAVECATDSGVHGYGSDPDDEPYARSGTNQPPYTDTEGLSVDWGSSPTHQIITVYDSNYLNWYYNPPGSSMRRTDIVKAVTKNVLGSVNNVNVGFMRFHTEEGGPVIHAVKDLDDNRDEANDIVDGIPANGWTPLSETLYEAARYWNGMTAHYGALSATDPDALLTSAPMLYDAPSDYACAKNFVVLLTDGQPTRDTGANLLVPLLPGFTAATGRSACDGGTGNGSCLDDVAEYLSKHDINPSMPGDQHVTTYTIGFSVDLPILKTTAEVSGGEYYLASDVKSLTVALTDIVTNIFDRDISFTAPAVAVNAFNRTQHLNDLYVSVFRAADEVHWPGNMKKFTIKEREVRDAMDINAINPDTGYFDKDSRNFWSTEVDPDGANVEMGGAANALPHPSTRKMYTNHIMGDLTIGANALKNSAALQLVPGDLGLTGSVGEPSMADLIDWARGYDVQDEDDDPLTLTRESMGDTLHSQPAAVVYGTSFGTQDIVVFNATNDGYLHAINAETGQELWSFIPKELLPNLTDLYFNENVDYKNYGIDGDVIPVVYDSNNDGIITEGQDYVYLVFGMRRGGDNYYMLDVTDRYTPKLRWVQSYAEFGQSWSAPSVAKVKVQTALQSNAQNAVLVLGAGYDTAHDSPSHPTSPDAEGAGIFMLDLDTGAVVWRAGRDSNADLVAPDMTRSIPGSVRVIDLNGDGFADRMYAADLGGQLWRFDITNDKAPAALVAGGVIAQLGAEGLSNPKDEDTRRFYATPDIAMFTDKREDRRYLAISIGSGYRAHPLNNDTDDRFYSVRDSDVFAPLTQAQYNSYNVVKDSDLVEVSGQIQTVIPSYGRGWKLTLPSTEKILATSKTFDDAVYFVSFEPRVNSEDPCQAGESLNRLYRVEISNGDPVFAEGDPVPSTEEEANDARIRRLEQGGIAPSPVFIFPSPYVADCEGKECAPDPVACVGVECFDPGFENRPVRTLWTQDGIE